MHGGAAHHPADQAEHWGPWYVDAAADPALVHLPTATRIALADLSTSRQRIAVLGACASEPWWDRWTERSWERACAVLLSRGVLGA